MESFREVARTLIAAAAIIGFANVASPCYGEETQGQGGGAFLTLGLAVNGLFDLAPRVGLEYRSAAGLGVEADVGLSLPLFIVSLLYGSSLMVAITGDALAVVPLFTFGRSGALDLELGVPAFMWVTSFFPELMFTAGGAARLRFGLGSRWSLLVCAGAGGMFVLDSGGFHLGKDSHYHTSWWPDLKVGTAYRF